MIREFHKMIREKVILHSNFALTKNDENMPTSKQQQSAMDYTLSYQEHLLKMEDAIGQRMEAKIEEIIDRKFHECMGKAERESNQETNH